MGVRIQRVNHVRIGLRYGGQSDWPLSGTLIYVGHDFDVSFFGAFLKEFRPELRQPIVALIDPNSSLKCDGQPFSKLLESVDITELLPPHCPQISMSGIRINARRLMEARRIIRTAAKQGFLAISNDKSSSVGHLVCSLMPEVLLIQQPGDMDHAMPCRFDLVQSARANLLLYPLSRNWKWIGRIEGTHRLRHHHARFERATVCFNSLKPHYSPRLHLTGNSPIVHGTPQRECHRTTLWVGSRAERWDYFGARQWELLAESIGRLPHEVRASPLYVKPRSPDFVKEEEVLRSLWNGPVNTLPSNDTAEAALQQVLPGLVLSIGSTTSKWAHSDGFPSLVLYRSLELPPAVVAQYDVVFADVGPSIHGRPEDAVLSSPLASESYTLDVRGILPRLYASALHRLAI